MRQSEARSIAFAGLSIAICLVCLILFRGVLSIVQVIIIPVVLVLLNGKQPLVYAAATGISLLILSLIFFPVQVVFVFTYLLLAFFLQKVHQHSNHRPLQKWGLRILYLFIVGLMLFTGIIITDKVLGTQLNTMMLRLSRGDQMVYFLIILLEALVVSTIHISSLLFYQKTNQ